MRVLTLNVDAWEVAGDGTAGSTWSRHNGFARPWLMPERRIDYVFVGHPRLPDGAGLVEACEWSATPRPLVPGRPITLECAQPCAPEPQ